METDIADRFGATVNVQATASDQRQFFLVISASSGINLTVLAPSHGGRVVLNGRNWIVAELGFNDATALSRSPGVALVGGVSIDSQKLAAFGKLPIPKLPTK